MTYSLQGLNVYLSSDVLAYYWLTRIYNDPIREAHLSGDFHLHDLGVLGPYCCGWDLKDLIMRGFAGVAGKIESRPARHLRSDLGKIVNFFFTLQGEAAGAQAMSNFDTLLAPFIRHDGLSYGEVKQAFQEFTDNAVAKTVNLPLDTPEGEVGSIYRKAWELDLKGITVYRDGSRKDQVLQHCKSAASCEL